MISRFLSLLLLPLFTAYLSPTDYGVLALLALLSMVAQSVFSLGLGAAMGPSYFESSDLSRKSQTIWTAFILLIFSSSLLVVLAWTFAEQLSQLVLQSSSYKLLVLLTLTGCAINILSVPFAQRIQFEEKAKTFVVITLFSSLFTIFISTVAIVWMQKGVEGMVYSQLLGQLNTCVMFICFGARGLKFGYSKLIEKELLGLGLPLVPSFVFLFILIQGNRYILQYFKGLDEVGVFSIGFNFGMVMSIAVGALTTAWYPFFMSFMDKQDDAAKLFGKITTYYFFIFGFICVLFFIFAKPFIFLLTQPAFHEAYWVVGFTATAQFFIGAFNLLLPGTYYRKEVKYVSLVQGAAAFLSVPLSVLPIKLYGLVGAAIALSLNHLFMVVLQYLFNVFQKSYIKIIYDFSRISKFACVFIFIASLSFFVPSTTVGRQFIYSSLLALILIIASILLIKRSEWLIIRHRFLVNKLD